MKKVALLLCFLFSFCAISYSASLEAPEKRIDINTRITASNGCEFHVTGWIDVSVGFSGISVDKYDIKATGPCGEFHFTSSAAPPDGNSQEVEISPLQVTEIVTDIVNENIGQ
ncbi:MAG: hypothetical protein JJT94_14100 [Bernardetiaceae bacterium]|nr:hypothetical protein [Bernardetiaceae bacterium]